MATPTGTVSNNPLNQQLDFGSTDPQSFAGLPTYASDAAAGTGGLVTNDAFICPISGINVLALKI
jgi:hypothetical protein